MPYTPASSCRIYFWLTIAASVVLLLWLYLLSGYYQGELNGEHKEALSWHISSTRFYFMNLRDHLVAIAVYIAAIASIWAHALFWPRPGSPANREGK